MNLLQSGARAFTFSSGINQKKSRILTTTNRRFADTEFTEKERPSFFAFFAFAVKKLVFKVPLETPVGFPKVWTSIDLYALALSVIRRKKRISPMGGTNPEEGSAYF
jgi:hypothetical protein